MDKAYEFAFTQANIDFGKTTDTPDISYALALDIDKKVIRIPYSYPFVPISELVNNYLAITSHRKAFKQQPCLRILQGKKKLIVADPKIQLISLGLNLKEVCFRVEDTADPNPHLSDITNFLSGEQTAMSKDDKTIIKVLFEGKKIVHMTSCKKGIKELKQQLCKLVQRQARIKRQMISLEMDGSVLKEDKLIQYYGLEDKQIKMVIEKKEGCYRGNTLILNGDGKYVEIKSIKVGDRVKIYNRDTFQLQDSCVVSVYQTFMDECVKVKLKNQVEIYTTANHLFLCEDGVFRMVKSNNPKEICLKQHDYLRLVSRKTVEILEISSKMVAEKFYNVVTQSGHTVIIHDVISHHFVVKIQAADKVIHSIEASPTDSIYKIKQKLQFLFSINLNNQKLSAFSKQLNDNQTISDKNLNSETIINFSKKPCEDWFNALQNESGIVVKDGAIQKVNELSKQTLIAFYDPRKDKISQQYGAFNGLGPTQIQQYLSVTLSSGEFNISIDSYFCLSNGTAILGLDLFKAYQDKSKTHLPELKLVNGQKATIQKIQLVKKKSIFNRIRTNAPNFITSAGVIVIKDIINIIIRKSGKKIDKICLCVTKDTSIEEIKERVAEITKIQVKNQFLSFNGAFLDNMQTLSQKNINSQNVLIIDNCQKIHQSSLLMDEEFNPQFQDKKLNIQYEKENIEVKYATIADYTVKDVLKCYFKVDEISSHVLVFAGVIVYSYQKIKKIEEEPEFCQSHLSAMIIRNQKLSFLHTVDISSESIKSFSSIIFNSKQQFISLPDKSSIQVKIPNEFIDKIKKTQQLILKSNMNNLFKKEYFYMPFLLFTTRAYTEIIYRYIRKFDDYKQEVHSPASVFSIIRDLYCNMNWLQNYLRTCHYGLRNFKASLIFKPGHTFYFYNFTVPYKEQNLVVQQLRRYSGTLFYIQSTSGKVISQFSIFPDKNQILFAPFTYFLVERVKTGVQYDQVWLTEIASPATFRKDIILWVDDNPHYNVKQYEYILHIKKNIEILQVTSTQAAEKWIKEFGWILIWKGLRFKLISDMGRMQWRGQKKVENKEAGIDLLQLLYKVKGYSSKTMIFCGDQKKALKLAEGRKIPKQKYQITEKQQQLQPYVEISS